MSQNVRHFGTGYGVLVLERGTDGCFGSNDARPKFTEMVQWQVPRLATAYGEKSGRKNSRPGAAVAGQSLADDLTTRGEMGAG